jgi:Flp pilus assembly pilin Flp
MTSELIARVLARWWTRTDDGQGLAEYALVLALIGIISIVALLFLGGTVKTALSTVGDAM